MTALLQRRVLPHATHNTFAPGMAEPHFLSVSSNGAEAAIISSTAEEPTVYQGPSGLRALSELLAAPPHCGPSGIHTIVTAGEVGAGWQTLVQICPELSQVVLVRGVDMLLDFAVSQGYTTSLASVLPVTSPPGTSAANRCLATRKVWRRACRKGYLQRATAKGKVVHWSLPEPHEQVHTASGHLVVSRRFRNVGQCYELLRSHPPDQSWQTEPEPLLTLFAGIAAA